MKPSDARAALEAALPPASRLGGLSALLRRRAVVLIAAACLAWLLHAQAGSLWSSSTSLEAFEPLSAQPGWLAGSYPAGDVPEVERTVVYEADTAADPALPLVSIVLPLDAAAVGTLGPLVRSLMATTVGPYELLVVLGSATADAAKAVDELVMPHALERHYLAANYTSATQLGLRRFVRIKSMASMTEPRITNVGLAASAGRYIIVHEPSSRPLDFGWDRYLRRALIDHSDIFAVSARCAFDVRGGEVARVDSVGDCRYGQPDSSIGDHVEIRDAFARGPIMFDAAKLARVGPMLEVFDGDHDLIEVRWLKRSPADRAALLAGSLSLWLALRLPGHRHGRRTRWECRLCASLGGARPHVPEAARLVGHRRTAAPAPASFV